MKRKFLGLVCCWIGLIGYLNGLMGCGVQAPQPVESAVVEREFLLEVARHTWRSLESSMDPVTGFPADHTKWSAFSALEQSDYTTPTNVGLLFMAIPAARDFGFLTDSEAELFMLRLVGQLESMPNWHGHIANFFKISNGAAEKKRFYSSIDNAWLSAGLRVASESSVAGLRRRLMALDQRMDFSVFYDATTKQMRLGMSQPDNVISPYHFGLLCTEARLLSMIALANQQAPVEHWFGLYRTLPAEWNWQKQIPRGTWVTSGGATFFNGYYEVNHTPVVPSWGGSLFEFLMPLLVVPELTVAAESLGKNNRHVVRVQKEYALTQAGYPVWGFSPCAKPGTLNYTYVECGYPELGAKGYPELGIVTPHASVLAIEIDPSGVVDNLLALKQLGLWTEYGFLDAINLKTREIAPYFLSLDQSMIFISLHNYFFKGRTRKRFFNGPVARTMQPLLMNERFYPSDSESARSTTD